MRDTLAVVKLAFHHVVQLRAVGVVIIHTPFVLNPQENQQTTGHTEGQSQDIDSRKSFVADEVPPGNFEIVA